MRELGEGRKERKERKGREDRNVIEWFLMETKKRIDQRDVGQAPPEDTAVPEGVSEVREDTQSLLVGKTTRERTPRDLAERREQKELSPFDFDLNFIFQLNQINAPLRASDLRHETGWQALVLTRDDLETLGCLDFISRNGERMMIEPESLSSDDALILYPEDLGESEGQPVNDEADEQ